MSLRQHLSGQEASSPLPADPPPTLVAIVAAIFFVEFLLAVACLSGPRFGSDFVEYWSAARLGLHGQAAQIYSAESLFAAERSAVPALPYGTPWFYPPTFYLVVLPLGLLPYRVGYWVFEGLTLGLFLAGFRCSTRNRTALWCVLASPVLWINFLYGQNGFLTAALAALALHNLRRRPAVAGVLIGLLAIKPHMALLFPVALVAIRAWRAVRSAALTASVFLLFSSWVMGSGALRRCYSSLGEARRLLENGVCQDKMPTVFSFVRMLGAPVRLAYCLHALVAIGAVVVVWRIWRSCGVWKIRGAALMTATLLVSPYLQVYDLTWLAFPILWLTPGVMEAGWPRPSAAVLAASWLLPVLMAVGASLLHMQAGPWVVGALLWVAMRKALSSAAIRTAAGMRSPLPAATHPI